MLMHAPCLFVSSYVSPRARSQRTLELLALGCHDPYPWQNTRDESQPHRTDAKVTVTEDIREWDYGDYEGITSQEIRERRKAQGLGGWDIWRDGCPGGEYVQHSRPVGTPGLVRSELTMMTYGQVARTDHGTTGQVDSGD